MIVRNYVTRVAAFFVVGAIASGCYENFGDTIRVTPDGDTDVSGGVMAKDDSGRMHLLYGAELNGYEYMALRTSTDGENWDSWNMVQQLGASEDISFRLPVALISDTHNPDYLYAAYEWRSEGTNVVEFARSVDGGASWTHSPQPWEPRYGAELYLSQNPHNGTIVAAWLGGEYSSIFDITVATSVDNGVSFSEPTVAVTLETGDGTVGCYLLGMNYAYTASGTPRLVIAYNYNYDVRRTFYVQTIASDDDGRTWPTLYWEHVAEGGQRGSWGNRGHSDGALGVSNGGSESLLYLAWYDYTHDDADLRYAVSRNGGETWGAAAPLGNIPYGNGDTTHQDLVAGESGTMLFLYNLGSGGYGGNLYCHEFDGISSWSEPRRVNNHLHQGDGIYYRRGGTILSDGQRMVASWADPRWHADGDRELAIALSDPYLESDVRVEMLESSAFDEARRNEPITIDYVVENVGDTAEAVEVWLEYVGENSGVGTLKSDQLTLDPAEEVTLSFNGRVGRNAPYQNYELIVRVGSARPDVIDRDSFVAEVIP